MGSSSSKFRKHLQNGDEVAALNVYNSHSDLRKGLDPNSSYGDNYQHETPLHYAARHAMKSMLRIFLFEHGGNPNKTNGRKETALHCVCMEKQPQYYAVQCRRLDCLILLLQWHGANLTGGELEKVDIGALDEGNNTALHYAACSGLRSCVEHLVNHAAPLYVENNMNKTPCDCAESNGFSDIALYLESKMVFSNDGDAGDIEHILPEVDSEEYSGLRAQDLQEAKDQLLVETADMLSIPLFTAEALLRSHEWSREMLLDAWFSDPVACCQKSGVTAPDSLFSQIPILSESLSTPTMFHPPSAVAECDICTQNFWLADEPVHNSCHQFCKDCWEGYLNVKIQEGGVHDITCPGYGCNILVPVEVIENVVSRDMARKYLQFDIKAFVDSNPNIKWCPHPGCGRAVRLPENVEGSFVNGVGSPGHSRSLPNDTSRAVDCGNGHHFCWECNGDAHEPTSCGNVKKWFEEISIIKLETLQDTEQVTETAANYLWLVTNSKPCPNCKSPIQKNEGCNHMKCSKCKHDFCWVCLDQWKHHNSNTGGYFKCNRYEVSKKIEDTSHKAIAEAQVNNKKMQELKKFVHYYTRYKNHENSYKLEEPLLKTAKEKMLKLAEAVTDLASAKDETKFVEEAVHKLLRARRVLKYSYVYGYYLDGPPYRKIVFELMQTELEVCTEILSQMVNRLYLRTPRQKIMEQSKICNRKRLEFLTAISKGLVPPETPPNQRKKERRFSIDSEDEDVRKAILASIEDAHLSNPWILDGTGHRTYNAVLQDRPYGDSDDDDDNNDDISPSRSTNKGFSELHLDEHMDFLRAVEMSRLEFLQEQSSLQKGAATMAVADDTAVDADESNESISHLIDNFTPVQRLDIEIKRLLNLSDLGTDFEDTDKKVLDCGTQDQSGDEKSSSRFGENQSTIVSRVPNKSVEDLYHPDCTSCQGAGLSPSKHSHPRGAQGQGKLNLHNYLLDDFCLEFLGAYGVKAETQVEEDVETVTNTEARVEYPILQNTPSVDRTDSQDIITKKSLMGTGFGAVKDGAVKDISVSNIFMQEDEKSKHFTRKDLSSLTKNKSKGLERANGRLFSANTPGEDEKIFSLLSPESDFSESSSSEVWGYRPKHASGHVLTDSSETDSSVGVCSYADLPNQNHYYKHDNSIKGSPVVTEEPKLTNWSGTWNQQIWRSEITDDLKQITQDIQRRIDSKITATGDSEIYIHVSDAACSDPTGHLYDMHDNLQQRSSLSFKADNTKIWDAQSFNRENSSSPETIDVARDALNMNTVASAAVTRDTSVDSQLGENLDQNEFISTYV